MQVGIGNGNLRWYKNNKWDQIYVNRRQGKWSKTNSTYYVYDLQLLQLLCWSYSICLFRFSLKLSPYLNLQLLTFFQWKVWSLTHICITADNIANAFKEIWTQVVAVRYKEWGLGGCANIDNTIEINLQMLCFALMCAGKQCILLDTCTVIYTVWWNKQTNKKQNFFFVAKLVCMEYCWTFCFQGK